MDNRWSAKELNQLDIGLEDYYAYLQRNKNIRGILGKPAFLQAYVPSRSKEQVKTYLRNLNLRKKAGKHGMKSTRINIMHNKAFNNLSKKVRLSHLAKAQMVKSKMPNELLFAGLEYLNNVSNGQLKSKEEEKYKHPWNEEISGDHLELSAGEIEDNSQMCIQKYLPTQNLSMQEIDKFSIIGTSGEESSEEILSVITCSEAKSSGHGQEFINIEQILGNFWPWTELSSSSANSSDQISFGLIPDTN